MMPTVSATNSKNKGEIGMPSIAMQTSGGRWMWKNSMGTDHRAIEGKHPKGYISCTLVF